MSLPTPRQGLVVRYSYLWSREHGQGREEGLKDRPCAVLLAVRNDKGRLRVVVLPITHAPPLDAETALEIPAQTKRRLGLDGSRSWIILTEASAFTWPGPDLRMAPSGGIESVAVGHLPGDLTRTMRERYLALHAQNKTRLVRRTE